MFFKILIGQHQVYGLFNIKHTLIIEKYQFNFGTFRVAYKSILGSTKN